MINAIMYPRHRGWERVRANKAHIDLFGREVRPGHIHFVRKVGAGFADIERMSEDSMNRLLDALFLGNPAMAELARRQAVVEAEAWQAELRAAVLGTPKPDAHGTTSPE